MAQASIYTPGLQVTERTRIEKVRELPLPGKTLVKIGDRVKADTPVLSASLPGELDIVRIADRLGVEPADVLPGIKVKVGTKVKRGDLLCELKTFFGLFRSVVQSPTSGVVEFITEVNAHVGIRRDPIPLTVAAYVEGAVIAVEQGKSVTIETTGCLIQGIFGVGGERHGQILPLGVSPSSVVTVSDLERVSEDLTGAVLVGGSTFDRGALHAARARGVAAVVTGSIDAETLQHFAGSDVSVSITGDEDVPFSLIITEGFGKLPLAKRVMEYAEKFSGAKASVSGATQVRAGAMRPEIIIPSRPSNKKKAEPEKGSAKVLEPGSRVRAIRVPYFGELGTVTELPVEPARIESGGVVRVLKMRLDSGTEVTVPRANVELIG